MKKNISNMIYFNGIDSLQSVHFPLDIKKPKIGMRKIASILLSQFSQCDGLNKISTKLKPDLTL